MAKIHPISSTELFTAQLALIAAIGLQIAVWRISPTLHVGPQYLIFTTEILLVLVMGFTARRRHNSSKDLHRTISIMLLGLITLANITSLFLVLNYLITDSQHFSGYELLVSAIAIFLTNIIVFGLWYWEIDSPGLTGSRWSRHDKDFQFTQQDLGPDFKDWQPQFTDYLYLSVTNAINFAPADTRPITAHSKFLMGTQALVSVFTLALVIARSVSILG